MRRQLIPSVPLPLLAFLFVGVLFLAPLTACNSKKLSKIRFTFQSKDDILGSGNTLAVSRPVLETQWRRPIDPDFRFQPMNWQLSPEERAAPVIDADKGRAYIGSSMKQFTAFSIKSGKTVWTRKLQGRIAAKACRYKDKLFVGTTSGILYALGTEKGKVLWQYKADGEILSEAAIVKPSKGGNPLVLFTTSNNKITALQLKTGKWEWQQRHVQPDQLSIRGQAPPVVHNNVAYVGYSDGHVFAYNALDGSLLWKTSLKAKDRFADIDTPIVVEDDTVYASSYSGSFHALEAKSGKKKWSYNLSRVSRAALGRSKLYIASSDGWLVALSKAKGKKLWKKRFRKAGAFTNPVITESYVYVGSTKDGLYVVKKKSGKLVQRIRHSKGFSDPVVHQKQLFALSYGSFLYAFSVRESF